jgi:hypothetical protein
MGTTMEINNDFSELLKPYEDKWVVLSEDHYHILAHGDTLEEVSKFIPLGYVIKVPKFIPFATF